MEFSPMEPIDVVSIHDPALDRATMDVRRYAETRDRALVVVRQGASPRWWKLAPLDVTLLASISDRNQSTPHAAALQALMFSLVTIENHPAPGLRIEGTERITDPNTGRPRRIFNDADLRRLHVECGWDVLLEIGSFSLQRSSQGNGWSGGATVYALPLSSQLELERIERQRAAQNRARASTTTSDGSSSGSPPGSAPSSADPSGAPAAPSVTTSSPGG